jgi:6-pyruvoyl-tetrahydropterin synthase-like protein
VDPPALQRWFDRAVVAVAGAYVFLTLQAGLLLTATTTNGGDTGAHVWWPAFMRDHLLPKLRLSGWTMDWYAGFPGGHFYFPLPSLLVVLLDLFLPYNVAFKLVTAIGPVALPAAAYYFARGLRAPWPAPPLFAVATLPYLFFTGYTIYGGNLASTLAGEFSFTIALCLALCFLGALARALEEHRQLALPAALLAGCAMSHLIVAVFAAVGAVIVWLCRRPVANLRVTLAIGAVGTLITAIWSLPLVARLGYATDMGWTKITAYRDNLLPDDLRWAFVLALVAVVVGIGFSRPVTLPLAALAVLIGVAFVLAPESRLWNARLLPFYYLLVMFLAALGTAELVGTLGRVVRRVADFINVSDAAEDEDVEELAAVDAEAWEAEGPPAPAEDQEPVPVVRRRRLPAGWALPAAAVAVALVAAMSYTRETRSFLPAWIRWNYGGYEVKPAYPEFREVIETMRRLPPGRALWEPSSTIDKYGTTLALELLPHFTDGRIGSMEGLYFESAATTPYHFMMVAELAKSPSNPVRDLKYRTISDFGLGVRHMKLFGVRYYLAQSAEAKAEADIHPDLRLVAETGSPKIEPQVARWRIYEVLNSPLVEPLANEPVVLTGVSPHGWLRPAAEWFDDPGALDRPLSAGGPSSWARAAPAAARDVPSRPLPEVEVTDIRSGEDWVRFRVSRPGVPVVVKVSYFPNWQVKGAQGPWRVSPNLMVVVPTGSEVSLGYGRTPVDWAGIALTVLGLLALAALARWRLAPLPERPSRSRAEEAGEGEDASTGPTEEPAPVFT